MLEKTVSSRANQLPVHGDMLSELQGARSRTWIERPYSVCVLFSHGVSCGLRLGVFAWRSCSKKLSVVIG